MDNHSQYSTIEESAQNLRSLLEQAYAVRVKDLPESIRIAVQVIRDAEQLMFDDIVAAAKNMLGLFYMITGDFEKSVQNSSEALRFFERIHNKKGIADAKYNIASTYYKTDDFHKGLKVLIECLTLYREIDDRAAEAKVLKAIGTVYEYFGDSENAAESYKKCIEVARSVGDLNMESNAYNPLSGIYLKRGMLDEAMEISQKSIEIKRRTKDERGLAFSLYGRAKVYMRRNDFVAAKKDFEESLSINRCMGDKLGEGMALNKLAVIYLVTQDYVSCRKCLEEALELSRKFQMKPVSYKSYLHLYELNKKEGRFQEALEALEKHTEEKEIVKDVHSRNIISSYEAIYKVEILEREAKIQKDFFDIIQRKNADLDTFFHHVSHDIKGPLNSLLGIHQLVKYENFDTNVGEYFNMYHRQVMRIHNIVMDLIKLTQMTHANENRVLIDFRQLAEECIQSSAHFRNFDRIRFDYEIESDLGFSSQWVVVNTIFQNLIENAIKYSRESEDSFIRIRVYKDGQRVNIEVTDNGIGISEEKQEKIFEIFYRGNTKTPGSGLGLYILKRAVERLRGEIKVKSKEGEGTAFTVCLPFA